LKRIWNNQTAPRCLLLGLAGLLFLPAVASRAQDDDVNEALLQMVVDLVTGDDADMRTLGFQQIREEMPGAAATTRFAELLPKLPAEAQVGLLDALGDRRDKVARPAILDVLNSPKDRVRAAALRALGALGSEADVPLLVQTAAPSDLEQDAARQSLIRLRGEEVNAAILTAIAEGGPKARATLLGVLAARNATENLPTVLQCARDPNLDVRLAALDAIRYLADENQTAEIVDLLKTAEDETERRKAELALLVIVSRGGEACAEPIIAGLGSADPASRAALLRALARAGGASALETIVAHSEDDGGMVRDEAMRMLSIWQDPAAKDRLLMIAQSAATLQYHVLAVRGLVQLASPQEDKPADLEILADVMRLARRSEEKSLALGILGGVGSPEALALATAALDDPVLANEAGLATVRIVETIENGDKDELRAALKKVLDRATNQQVRQRAQDALAAL